MKTWLPEKVNWKSSLFWEPSHWTVSIFCKPSKRKQKQYYIDIAPLSMLILHLWVKVFTLIHICIIIHLQSREGNELPNHLLRERCINAITKGCQDLLKFVDNISVINYITSRSQLWLTDRINYNNSSQLFQVRWDFHHKSASIFKDEPNIYKDMYTKNVWRNSKIVLRAQLQLSEARMCSTKKHTLIFSLFFSWPLHSLHQPGVPFTF